MTQRVPPAFVGMTSALVDIFTQPSQFGKVEFWFAKLLASRSGGLSKQEKGFEK